MFGFYAILEQDLQHLHAFVTNSESANGRNWELLDTARQSDLVLVTKAKSVLV